MNSDRPQGAGEPPRDASRNTAQDSARRADAQPGSTPGAREAATDKPAAAESLAAEDLSHDLPQRLADAEARANENLDKFLRAHAEMDNVRRRAQEEVARAHKFAIESFAESLLPVKDSLELALKADSPSVESIREGVEATLRLLATAFEKNRLVEVDPTGQRFDPNVHQAISMVPAAGAVPANHVVTVLQKGYMINERVLRPALVTVAQG